MTATDTLRELDLFRACGDAELDMIGATLEPPQTTPEGTVLCTEGEESDRWWVILAGEATVTVEGRYVATIGTGESVGEMGAIDGAPRAATVTAATPLLTCAGEAAALRSLVDSSASLASALLRQVTKRLRETDERTTRPSRPSIAVSIPAPPAVPVEVDGDETSEIDPLAPGYFDDPYPSYAAVREHRPVHQSAVTGSWVVSRYEDVQPLIRSRALSHDLGNAASTPAVDAERARFEASAPRGTRSMLRLDAPDHTRLRKLVSRSFTPKAVKSWRPRVETIVDEILDQLAALDEADLIADYAGPLPTRVISELLGMPTDAIPTLREWSHALTKTLDPINTPEEVEASNTAAALMWDFIAEVIEAKRRDPSDDLLSELISIEEEGDRLTTQELLDTTTLLYVAGHETTVNLIGNGVTALLAAPGEYERLRLDPSLDANAVEELLRYDSPVQMARRFTTEAIEVRDTKIPPGATVVLATAGANRDPRHWGPTADVVDVGRPSAHEHLSFGGGPHHCLGASLARLEGQVAIARLIRRFPGMRARYEAPAWESRMILRGVSHLPVSLHG